MGSQNRGLGRSGVPYNPFTHKGAPRTFLPSIRTLFTSFTMAYPYSSASYRAGPPIVDPRGIYSPPAQPSRPLLHQQTAYYRPARPTLDIYDVPLGAQGLSPSLAATQTLCMSPDSDHPAALDEHLLAANGAHQTNFYPHGGLAGVALPPQPFYPTPYPQSDTTSPADSPPLESEGTSPRSTFESHPALGFPEPRGRRTSSGVVRTRKDSKQLKALQALDAQAEKLKEELTRELLELNGHEELYEIEMAMGHDNAI
ncbi:hypothetical protein CYLTODRAFT_68575 [Cylindrobasidium torrendii FP15055 ss-10]|uniref:Uncharacterized protein n=1 Tax=Cylindrobasidium torrendii FP15055 ss-10 TaxID=1314674 RepID=A0A0D7B526_9AGAR|nr:hypothetical protein CYLTODRAFT_68575 [Cylindrobasidium torrendii FP15055 ss-10]